jgi:type I restriction enzyme, S subunit
MSARGVGQWREITLGEVAEFMSGGTPSKENAEYWVGTIPWVSAKDMKQFRLDDSIDHVSEEVVRGATKLVPANTVFLLVRGMTLLNDVPICVTRRPMTFNQDIKALRPLDGLVEDFLPYLLLGHKETLLNQVDLAGHGTGRLNTDELKSLEVLLPSEDEQRGIVAIFSAIDDKIELNRKMNETLEAMARALFKSWFVNFDPVRAKAEGRDSGLSADIAALFPNSFESSVLGEAPRGWQVGRLDDLLVLQRGFDLPKTTRTDGPYSVLAASGPSGTHHQFMVRGPGVTTGRSGVLGNVFYVHEDFWPLNTSLWVKDFKKSSPTYAFYLLRLLDLHRFNAGSAVPTLNRNHIHGLPVVIPPADLVQKFEAHAVALLRRQRANELESSTLASLREALLPKLISGELKIPQAERMVEAHN